MRKLLTALLATAAFGAAPVAAVRAQTAQDTLGRAPEGLQGGQDQRRDDRGYRDTDRRSEDRNTDRRGTRDSDDRRSSTGNMDRRLDERQRRLGDERRPVETERRRSDRERR